MNQSHEFQTNEVAVSQLPAMVLLAQMGWKPLTAKFANEYRRGRRSSVILEDVTRQYLRAQTIVRGEQTTKISEDNIDKLIYGLKDMPSDKIGPLAKDMWNRLVLPQSVEQSINGTRRALSTRLIDFESPDNNIYHAVAEFDVECSHSTEKRRPDIVLFVNGIPLAVIECKKTDVDVQEGVTQTIRNQKPENIPNLYVYAQILLSINKNNNRYGTTGTSAKLWCRWREGERDEQGQEHEQDRVQQRVQGIMDIRLADEDHQIIANELGLSTDAYAALTEHSRQVTNQDRALAGLCHPHRLLHMMRNFILFSGPSKVIARFQQVDAVNKTLDRIKNNKNARPRGGVIWHTQGSGKSLTMVMLARALIGTTELNNARIILVTDRVDLDKQIEGTFHTTGMEPKRANTGRELTEILRQRQARVVTTIINKFEAAAREKFQDESSDIFVLVDEGHRTQYGSHHAQMMRVLPNACYLAFTGTPIAKKDRSTMAKFGEPIDTYTMRDAIKDGAVVPLIYEGRMIKPDMDKKAIDTWFARLTIELTDDQKADLKQKYARANLLSKLDNVVTCRAFDISVHYCLNFKDTGMKGQLVAPDKKTALKYKEALDLIGNVSSEVLISAPDTRKGHEEIDEGEADSAVVAFWEKMMRRWGNEKEYNERIIYQFKNVDDPEIIIVVSKLLTGFDAPRNTVLYLTKRFSEPETLLQAVARVNRVLDTDDKDTDAGKDAGFIIDYEGILENLDRAITKYDAMAGYREQDVSDIFRSSISVLNEVPQKHCELLDIFKSLTGEHDMEAHEQFLRDKQIRDDFYEALQKFSKALSQAFALARFYEEIPAETIARYKRDFKKYVSLRTAVKRRYGEEVDFLKYEASIEKMLHTHVSATDIVQVVPPIDIFNIPEEDLLEDRTKSKASKADTMAYNMKREFAEHMDENPALYKELSTLLQELIDDFVSKRLSESAFFNGVRGIYARAKQGGHNTAPTELASDPHAAAFHGFLLVSPLQKYKDNNKEAIAFAKYISECFERHWVVDMFERKDPLNLVRKDLDNYMYDNLKAKLGWSIPPSDMDDIQDGIFRIAQSRMQK